MSENDDKRERAAPAPAPGEDERDETFLRRWSRRKQEAHRTPAPQPAEPPQTAEAPAAPARILTDADMPPLESLDADSDFSPFMSPGVSEALRRQALRKLFLSPAINQRCPLDSEWFDGEGSVPLGDTITLDMRDEWERAAKKLKESAQRVLGEDGAQEPDAAPSPQGAYGDLPDPNRARPAPAPVDVPSPQDEVPRKDPT